MTWNDAEYFRSRADIERALAAKAPNPVVAEVHLELAERYEKMIREGDRPTLHVVPSSKPVALR